MNYPARYMTIPVPMPGGARDITIEGSFPVSEADWSFFMTVIRAMKPGLVRDPDPVLPSPDAQGTHETGNSSLPEPANIP